MLCRRPAPDHARFCAAIDAHAACFIYYLLLIILPCRHAVIYDAATPLICRYADIITRFSPPLRLIAMSLCRRHCRACAFSPPYCLFRDCFHADFSFIAAFTMP